MVVEKVRAWELMCDPEFYSSLPMSEVYRLNLLAGESEEYAQRAANRRGWDRMSAGMVQ